ncbi:MAG: caspase family protein, partial [Bacteroidota bacterium]
DQNASLEYRIIWFHRQEGKSISEWQILDTDFLFIDLPTDMVKPPVDIALGNGIPISTRNALTTTSTDISNYALFFAVNQYEQTDQYSTLTNPINDAESIAQELSEHYGFQTEVVTNPSREEIRNKMEAYHQNFQSGAFNPNGQLFIYFSGHGDYEDLSENGCFLPSDTQPDDLGATAFQYAYWRPRIDNIPCKHILVAIDACYSGTFDPAIAMRSGGTRRFGRPDEPSEQEQFLADFQARTTRLYLASGGKEKTPDRSLFAKKILEGLRVTGTNEVLTVGQLYENHVRRTRPLPLIGEFGSDEAGSNFLFIKL